LNGPCPDTLVLRIHAEGELDDPTGRVAQHISGCKACRLLVERARLEEKVLREQLKLDMPAGLHAKVMRALDASSDVRHRSTSRRLRVRRDSDSMAGSFSRKLVPLAISVAILVATGAGVSFLYRHASSVDRTDKTDESPRDVIRRVILPPDAPPSDIANQGSEQAPALAHTPPAIPPKLPEPAAVDTETLASGGTPSLPEPTPATDKHDAPPSAKPPVKPDVERDGVRVLAVLRSGKLTVAGKALAPGDALPEGETVEAGSTPVELESASSAKLVLAPSTKLTVKKGESDEAVFLLASGKVFAKTWGIKPYSIQSADARTTPMGTEFLVAVEAG